MSAGRIPTTANSPLTAKGDLFGYSTQPARLAVGSDGDTIVADSSTATGLRYQADFAAGKNKIINGDFGIWQRGTTFNAIPTNTYFADRFATGFVGAAAGHTVNITRQAFTLGSAPVAGYESPYYMQIQRTVAGDEAYFGQKIEDVRTFAGQTVTFSFWARVTSGTWTMARVFLNQQFGSGGSGEVDSIGLITPTLTTSWQRFSTTVTIPSIAGKTIGTGSSLWALFQLGNNLTTGTLQFWGVQVEASNTATAFQTATGTIQGELAACQRYYVRYSDSTTNYAAFGIGQITSSTAATLLVSPQVRMRVKPSSIEYSNLGIQENFPGGIGAVISLVIENNAINPSQFWVVAGMSGGFATFQQARLIANNSSAAFLGFSAEL